MNDVPLSIFKVLNFILDEHTYFRDCKKKEEKAHHPKLGLLRPNSECCQQSHTPWSPTALLSRAQALFQAYPSPASLAGWLG